MSGPLNALRHKLDIKPAHHHTRPLATGVIVIGLIMLALVSAAIRHVPLTPKGGHTVQAEFTAANQVSSRTVVRVGGIEVGRVDKVQAGSDPRRTTLVTMRITDNSVHLHSDATAQVRWRTLLGGLMYIDLVPGSPSAPPLGNRPIPASHTSNQVELDDLLQPYDGGTSQAQRDMLKGLRDTFANPQGVGRTLKELPALTTVAKGVDPLLGRRTDDLQRLVAATAKTVHGLDNTAALRTLVSSADRTLAVTEARRIQLGQTLELSPPSLSSTFTTMRRLRTTLGHLDPLAASLRPGARSLGPATRAAAPALVQTQAVLREVRPLLRAAGPTFDSLRGASHTGVPLMQGLDPTLTRLLNELLPYLRQTDSGTRLKNYEAIGPFWSTLASAAAEFDSEGHRIRFTVPLNTNSFVNSPISASMTSACTRAGVPGGQAACARITRSLGQSLFASSKTLLRSRP
jgi:ABC-type transporter Mla subunit MlaD